MMNQSMNSTNSMNNMQQMMPNGPGLPKTASQVALCASCDRCRARKTKCDGNRPCGNCASKYMKKHKLTSIEGIDFAEFDCVYSPAKRRGPIPRSRNNLSQSRFSQSNLSQPGMEQPGQNAQWGNMGMQNSGSSHQLQGNMFGNILGQQKPQQNANFGNQNSNNNNNDNNMMQGSVGQSPEEIQQQINMLQQLQQQQQQQSMNGMGMNNDGGGMGMKRANDFGQPEAQRIKQEAAPGIPQTITNHTHLLEPTDVEGAKLHAYYTLSIDELFGLPATPSDEEYCARLNEPGMTPQMIPGSQLAALSASRFAEIALGALVHGEVGLGMELCNAVVHCLRESVQDVVRPPTMAIVSKAYFLLAIFRAYRGDMLRYFKYRRVSLTYLSKMEDSPEAAALLSAMSYLDSWAYMVHNGNERLLPSVDDSIPPINNMMRQSYANQTELKFEIRTDCASIASNQMNKNWIQGPPPIYLNDQAPLNARSLDALACAIRTCCDQANNRFASMAKETGAADDTIPLDTINTATSTAVQAHEDELCSKNMVLSAYTLLQQEESNNINNNPKKKRVNEGQQLIISAMDAFLENSDEDGNGGFSDSQIQSLLSVCNIAIENPLILHHAGPTYHIISNAAILIAHLLNGMHSMKGTEAFGAMEATMFEEVLDTFTSVRKLLTVHRRKLPVKLRCHGIPRPSVDGPKEGQPYIDVGQTLLCPCRGCQGFALMACSPDVACERARQTRNRLQEESAQQQEAMELKEIDEELDLMGEEFNVDDDALLNMISSMITN